MKINFDGKITLIIASSNLGKLNEFKSLLNYLPLDIRRQPNNLKVEENGETFVDNARIKATHAAELTGEYCLADDSGLCIDSLGGCPGVHSSRYAEDDNKRIQKVLKELSGQINRNAYFIAAICLVSPSKELLLEVQGRCDGSITFTPRGDKGFGYDPIFEVANTGKTFAEMDKAQKQQVSHRGKAFNLLKPSLEKIIESL